MFPTEAATTIAKNVGLLHEDRRSIIEEPALAAFQRISILHDFDKAYKVYESMLSTLKVTPTDEQIEVLKLLHELTKIELDGVIIGGIGKVFSDANLDGTKLEAGKVLHAIAKGQADVDEKSVGRLIVNLSKE